MKWVRPVVVLVLTAGIIIGFFTDRLPTEAFAVFATGLVTFWFRSRDDDKAKMR